MKIGIIGGGAAGFFAAVASSARDNKFTILEKSQSVLSKVRISGGGRCNVTNSLAGINDFVKSYPRGSKELISVFSRFSNLDTFNWFESRGVKLKTEPDGRVFPVSNDSATVINLFTRLASERKVNIITGFDVTSVVFKNNSFLVKDKLGNSLSFDKLLVASGGFSSPEKYKWIESLGHSFVKPVPSLFTFNCKDPRLKGLQGISLENVKLKIRGCNLSSEGPVLITHWGFSGPAILRLSAFGARLLNDLNYKFSLVVSWKSNETGFQNLRKLNPQKHIIKIPVPGIPLRLWESLVLHSGINPQKKYIDLSKKDISALNSLLTNSVFEINGKSTFKEEFVTAGGVSLREVNFKTMESKIIPGLFFAGEILDIDGITGGFNFQSAWSTAFIASQNLK